MISFRVLNQAVNILKTHNSAKYFLSVRQYTLTSFIKNQPLLTTSIKFQTPVICRTFLQTKSQGIQDNISSLQLKKRAARKKRTLDDEVQRTPGQYDVVAFATAEEYNLESLIEGLKAQNLYDPESIDNNPDVVHAVAKIQVQNEPREIFFFREGSVVLWNVTDLESGNILAFLRKFEMDSYSDKLVQSEAEVMNYRYSEEGYVEV